jgi:hypothetical protein
LPTLKLWSSDNAVFGRKELLAFQTLDAACTGQDILIAFEFFASFFFFYEETKYPRRLSPPEQI